MLVNCPKCGFSQPKDRYCANCGVDMELYRPKKTPFWKKVLGSPILHVAIVFAVVLAAVLYIRDRQQEELKARVDFLKNGPVMVERQQKVELSASAQAQDQLARENATTTTQAPQASSLPPSTGANEASVAAGPTTVTTTLPPPNETGAKPLEKSAKSLSEKNIPNRAVIIYAEVDRTVLALWMDEMRTNGQFRAFDGVATGILPDIAQKMKDHGVRVLQQMEQPLQTPPQNYDWFAGTHKTRDPENEIGIFSSLALTDTKDGLIRGDFEVQRAFRDRESKDPAKPLERMSFGGPFELPPGSAYVMRGLLPPKFLTDVPEDAAPDPFLSIFNSRSFANGQTEFTLILQFDTSGPIGR